MSSVRTSGFGAESHRQDQGQGSHKVSRNKNGFGLFRSFVDNTEKHQPYRFTEVTMSMYHLSYLHQLSFKVYVHHPQSRK